MKTKNLSTTEVIFKCNTIFVCLPTPMNSDSSCSTDLVEWTIDKICKLNKYKTIVIKSTIHEHY